MKEAFVTKIEEGEFWFSGIVDDTLRMPYGKDSEVYVNPFEDTLVNQINPVLVSSTGRYVYAPEYFAYEILGGVLRVFSDGEVFSGQAESFQAACESLRKKYYPPKAGRLAVSSTVVPQYCTWMALGYDQTQEGVVAFAKSILAAGMPAGVLIIDDGWSDYYGDWTFSKHKFPDPKKMCEELKGLGFKVAVWICPYVSPDMPPFRYLRGKGYLLTKNGKPYIAEWWDGFSACIDFTNPEAKKWFVGVVNDLVALGVDGVKMDGGDRYIYGNGVDCYAKKNVDGLFLSEAYASTAVEFDFAELRGAAKTAGLPVFQRIGDRTHAWEDSLGGFDGIVKKSLLMSVFGYPFNAPDMVGGGLMADWGAVEDEELNIRYMQAATFMPAVQFSKTLWTYGDKMKAVVDECLALRARYAELILKESENCLKTGEPIVKPLLWAVGEAPETWDEFLLGETLLVAPVLKKGQTERPVYLPNGEWRYAPTGETYVGGKWVSVPAPIEVLPYFEKR